MTLDYAVVPLPAAWPGKATPSYQRKRAPFKTIWTSALGLLAREIRYLGGKNVRLAVDVDEYHIRQDGLMRADARPSSPAIIVIFDTDEGTLQFPCDRFSFWQANVDAVARVLEDLRRADRYGVQAGRQYVGFRALPSATTASLSVARAAELLASFTDANPVNLLRDKAQARAAIRRARASAHPDAGGTAGQFAVVQQVAAVLAAHFGVPSL